MTNERRVEKVENEGTRKRETTEEGTERKKREK